MHRLVTLQVVTPTLQTVPMRTIGRDEAEILLGGFHLQNRHFPVLMKL